MDEQPKVKEFLNELKQRGFTSSEIIDILSSIIQRQMMFGGDLNDSLQFELLKAKNLRTKITDYKELFSYLLKN